jgi:hypothetical protein
MTYLGTPIVSGTTYDIKVIVPGTKDKSSILQLSKSGKVVNMYNTMKMAKRVSKRRGLTDIVHRVSGTIF